MVLVAYANDLALLVSGKTTGEIKTEAENACRRIVEWMKRNNLKIASEKSETLVAVGRHTIKEMAINIKEVEIRTLPTVRYLGITIGKNFVMTEHIKETARKAERMAEALVGSCQIAGGLDLEAERCWPASFSR